MLPPSIGDLGAAIATPATAIAANAAMNLILFMVWFLSLLGVYVFLLGCGSYESANQATDERRPDFTPVLRVESAAVMVVVVMLRLMVTSGWWWIVVGNLMPRLMLRRRGVAYVAVRVSLCHLFHRSGLCCLRRLRLHRRGCLALGRLIAFRSRHCRSAKCAADRERQHHLLYYLVHCRVPFVASRKPILALTQG